MSMAMSGYVRLVYDLLYISKVTAHLQLLYQFTAGHTEASGNGIML